MKKPHENRQKLERKRGGRTGNTNGKFVACLGSFTPPTFVQTEEYGLRVHGMCPVCGKWCVLRDRNLPRHKELAHVVQGWQVH